MAYDASCGQRCGEAGRGCQTEVPMNSPTYTTLCLKRSRPQQPALYHIRIAHPHHLRGDVRPHAQCGADAEAPQEHA
eukprot:4257124-Alexandrium_andersonii.AAC.1